jgi:hypothetical protein
VQTERDGQIVDWIGRMGAVGAEHVMRRFAVSRTVAYARLNSLVRDGLLEHHAILYARPGMYTASNAGLRWQGNQRLGGHRLSPGGFEHAWQLVQAAVEIEGGLPAGSSLISEREIRAFELDEGKPLASAQVGEIAGAPRFHRPDLAVVCPDERVISIEVELSVKSASRLAAICRGWARARHVECVYYLAAAAPERAVTRAVRATHTIDRIRVIDLARAAQLAEDLRRESQALAVRA